MKKIYLYVIAGVLAIAGCAKTPSAQNQIIPEEEPTATAAEDEADPEANVVTIKASIEGETKTTYTEDTGSMKAIVGWEAGDKISVLYSDGGYKKTEFTTTSGDGTFTGTPSGTEGGTYAYWAIYPYDICTDLYPSSSEPHKESTTITLPTEYTGNGANGIPMLAHTLKANFDGTYHLKHMGSVIRFKFSNIPSSARHLMISNDSNDLAGRYYTSYDSANDLIYYTSGTNGDGDQRSVTYHFTPNLDGTYSFYLPFGVNTPSGNFTFTFKDSENAEICSRTTTLGALASTTLVRNTMYRVNMDAMSFDGYPFESINILTISASDIPNVPSGESSFTVGGFSFHGIRIENYGNKNTDIKYMQDGTDKTSRIYNTSDFGRIIRIVINNGASAYYNDSFTLYGGTSANPTSTVIPYSSSVTNTSSTYNFARGNYHYFNVRINSDSYNSYMGSIQIHYIPNE